jgi:hypothetical protein
MDGQVDQEAVIAQLQSEMQELSKVKLKDVPLEPFNGEPKNWKTFKLHLQMVLADLNCFSILTQEEPFPVPANDNHPTPLEAALIRHYFMRDRLAKRIIFLYCKGEAASIVLGGDTHESCAEPFRRLRSRYEGDRRSQVATLLTKLHERRTLKRPEEMGKHLQTFLDIANELRELENAVPVAHLKAIIARSLPPGLYEHTLREDLRNQNPNIQNDIHHFCDQLRHDQCSRDPCPSTKQEV